MDLQTEGVFTIVVNKKQEVLLVKRKDLPIWDLPGGRVDGKGIIRRGGQT